MNNKKNARIEKLNQKKLLAYLKKLGVDITLFINDENGNKKLEEVHAELIDLVFNHTKHPILNYCKLILDQEDGQDTLDFSLLYRELQTSSLDYDDLLIMFGEYFQSMYVNLVFYTSIENYEASAMISDTIKKEINNILNYVLINFKGLAKDVFKLQEKFKDHYL